MDVNMARSFVVVNETKLKVATRHQCPALGAPAALQPAALQPARGTVEGNS